jgi:PEP-CTERM motif
MRRTIRLFSLALTFLLISSGIAAHADTTYDITTTTVFFGTASGTITGTGTTLTGFDITTSSNGNTFIFNSSIAGNSGDFESTPFTLQDGTPVNFITLSNASNALADTFNFDVTGDFTSGLTDVLGDTVVFSGGREVAESSSAVTFDPFGDPETSDNLSLTLQPPASVTPEPSSFVLMGTGLIGCFGGLRRRLRA